jgi:hypothetical protein
VIVRVLTANVQINRSGQLHELMRRQLPLLRSYDGLVYVKLARRMEGQTEQIVLIEEWQDAQAMYAWTGPNVAVARLLPGTAELIDQLSITHYEALDIEVSEEVAEIVRHTDPPSG